MTPDDRLDLLDLVFVQADHAQTDQVGDVIGDLVGGASRLEARSVLAVEFLDALLTVLDPTLQFGERNGAIVHNKCANKLHERVLSPFQCLEVVCVELAKGLLLGLEI